jgi:hypothetical protein
VVGSRVKIWVGETHRTRLYFPRHECFVTVYLHTYSGSSSGLGVG